MLELADAIEAAPRQKFDMSSFVGKFTLDRAGRRRRDEDATDEIVGSQTLSELKGLSCGTSACIAGWAIHLHPRASLGAAYDTFGNYDVENHARAILGLTYQEANDLFYGRMGQNNVQAAKFLRRCVELGTVPST